jgi:hypothetical protein
VTLPLPEFPLTKLQGESNNHYLERIELSAENVVGSYGRTEHDACIEALPKVGRLSQVLEKAGVLYSPRLESGTEASTEAAKKTKMDGCTRPVEKRVKIVWKKNVVSASKPAPAPKPVAVSKAAKASKASAASKPAAAKPTAAPKVAIAKDSAPAVSKADVDASPSKATAGRQKGVCVLKISTKTKRLAVVEPLLTETAKWLPVCGAGDERVKLCPMLGVASTNPDAAISPAVVVSGMVISEMLEPEVTHRKVECDRIELGAPHGAGGSVGMSLD